MVVCYSLPITIIQKDVKVKEKYMQTEREEWLEEEIDLKDKLDYLFKIADEEDAEIEFKYVTGGI